MRLHHGFCLMTNSMWVHCIFYLPCSLISFHPMINRKWVTPHFLIAFHPMANRQWGHCIFSLYNAVSLHFTPQPTECEWHSICFLYHAFPKSHITNRLWVTLHCLPCSLIAFIPWPTGSKWHCIVFFSMQSHCIFSHDQQYVSYTAFHLYHAVSLCFILWQIGSEWHCIF